MGLNHAKWWQSARLTVKTAMAIGLDRHGQRQLEVSSPPTDKPENNLYLTQLPECPQA